MSRSTPIPSRQTPVALVALTFCLLARDSAAQDSTARGTVLRPVTVTATRRETETHNVAAPVSVLDSIRLRRLLPASAADALRGEPGVDVIGTGPNQGRPAIRGMRGQRILLLEDGLRLNNARRQQDFGELPAIVDVDQLDRIEVVRGPASVLYGTDAIGGVVNLVTRRPGQLAPGTTAGRARYQFGSAGSAGKTGLSFSTANGNWSAGVDASARVAGDYTAPAGSYGNVTLDSATPLQHSGVRDRNFAGTLGCRCVGSLELFARAESYAADDAGFGFVPPALIGADPTRVEITYPKQEFNRISAGLRSGPLAAGVADRADLTVYRQRNTRDLAQHIFAPFGPGTPPGAGADVRTANFTDITTVGFRAEATKAFARTVFTYGADLFSDRSVNRDSSQTTIVGFGPPQTQTSNRPQVPNASLTSGGLFAQGDVRLHDRVSVILGARGQWVASSPQATAGRSDSLSGHSNSVAVYAANAIWRASDVVSFVATAGRGFRSPNLVERYYDGPTPEGSAYQRAAPELRPETSQNFDGGLKLHTERVAAEVSIFQNEISDAIVTAPTGERQGTLPVYRNVNVERLRLRGGEASVTAMLAAGFTLSANYSRVKSTNLTSPNSPVGDTHGDKAVGTFGWSDRAGRFWTEYSVRRNGEQKDIDPDASPVGPLLPAFVVQNVRVGFRGWSFGAVRSDLTIGVNNIGNALYAEAANASFFRPEPGRSIVLGITTGF